MNKEEINEIVECLPKGRTPFYYFKDRYALLLMSLAFDKPASKSDVVEAGLGRLLDKPVVKEAMGRCGSAKVSREICDQFWPDDFRTYMLTLGVWGSNDRYWDQISRGGYNLVLQLNFSSRHTDEYYRLIDPERLYPFECTAHPVSRKGRCTLAWSRMDIDLENDEALIEEVQNDWIRKALAVRKMATRGRDALRYKGMRVRIVDIFRYVDTFLAPHMKVWDEAMLAATIWFLRKEIGIKRIYYHTHESGAALKRINYSKPPRSLYTSLPKRFCFEPTGERPAFFAGYRKAGKPREVLKRAEFQTMSWE